MSSQCKVVCMSWYRLYHWILGIYELSKLFLTWYIRLHPSRTSADGSHQDEQPHRPVQGLTSRFPWLWYKGADQMWRSRSSDQPCHTVPLHSIVQCIWYYSRRIHVDEWYCCDLTDIIGFCVLHCWLHESRPWRAWCSLYCVPRNPQNIKKFSYCCCYLMLYGVLDGEFTESFWWGLGVWLYRNFCITTYHRSLGWSEHTLGVPCPSIVRMLKSALSKIYCRNHQDPADRTDLPLLNIHTIAPPSNFQKSPNYSVILSDPLTHTSCECIQLSQAAREIRMNTALLQLLWIAF